MEKFQKAHDGTEEQYAEVTIEVSRPVDAESTLEQRERAILRGLRLDIGDTLSMAPGLERSNVTLSGTE